MPQKTKEYQNIIDFVTLKITFVIWIIIHVLGIPELRLQNIVTRTSIIVKMLHFVFLYLIIKNIRRLILERKNAKTKRELIISLIFFLISSITLLLIWPGTWSYDDIYMQYNISTYNLSPWQHFFSGLFHALCLQTLPFNTGVVIMQILIASMIVGYCVTNIIEMCKIRNKKQELFLMLILFIPYILPPVLYFLFSGFRMGIYSFLESFLITQLIIHYNKNDRLSFKELLDLSLLTVVVASWRTEAIYYVGVIFIVFLLYGKKIIDIKTSIITTCVIGLSVLTIGKMNTKLIGNSNYSITASIMPVTELVKVADEVDDKKALDKINQLIDISKIYENPNKTGIRHFWDGIVRKNYTKNDYISYITGYISLAFKYPNVVLGSQFNLFLKTLDDPGIKKTISVFEENDNSIESSNWRDTKSMLRNPFNRNLRNIILRLMANVDKNYKKTPLHYFNWNLFIPITLVVVMMIIMLIRKKWLLSFLGLTIFARAILVFMTACGSAFMYYLSVYLVGYIYSIIMIYMLIYDKKKSR